MIMKKKRKVSIIICCYNEESNIPVVVNAIHNNMAEVSVFYDYEIIAVNDGSNDGTQELLENMSETDECLFYIELSKNFGHSNALKAGLDMSTGDAIISMDADMQHPPEMLPVLLQEWENGYDIVYTRREEDPAQGLMKRKTSKWFYRCLNSVSDIKLEAGTADFRLIDIRVLDVLSRFKGTDLFIRGIVSWMGFRQKDIMYTPHQRFSGKSKYTLQKMLNLAAQGILSFSTKPLKIVIYVGLFFAMISFFFIPYAFISLYAGHVKAGWVSLILSVSLFGGLQLFVLGVLGLYLGSIFTQTKGFPSYIVRSTNLSENGK
ncbi:glycosyltransferase family 2 protein [Dysgonomonas capnocytophagoides]|nr:glycosyltransferase family 2 protein [Dysgonomonas capnocytophagoides]